MNAKDTEYRLMKIRKDPLGFLLSLVLPLDLLIEIICIPVYWGDLDAWDKILSIFVISGILFVCLYEKIIWMVIADLAALLKTVKR